MTSWFKTLDRLLRGDATGVDTLKSEGLKLSTWIMLILILLLGMVYGACMGSFSVLGAGSGDARQIVASMLKVPALFLLTLLVTFPSMYVLNALVGSRLRFLDALCLLLAALTVMVAVLSSLGPIVAFFAVSTPNYPFMVLLNVVMFIVCGSLGMRFLMQTLHRMSIADELAPPPNTEHPAGALDPVPSLVTPPPVRTIFRIWIFVFGLVGAQMGWVLRPWLGAPGRPFEWMRGREQNIFIGVFNKLAELIKSWQ